MAKPKSLPYEAAESAGSFAVTLHNTNGGSDKIYKLSIEPAPGGLWVVNFANGRRGGTLATGSKTRAPVPYAVAQKECNKVLYEKVGGGYIPIGGSRFGEGMTAEAIATVARESSGHLPQLLNPIAEEDLETYLTDDRYLAQRKLDGERRLFENKNGEPAGGNRKGQSVALSAPITQAASVIQKDIVLDGEQVGDVFYAFDILRHLGNDLRDQPLEARLAVLERALKNAPPAIQVVESAFGAKAKRAMLEAARNANGEGLVFKKIDSSYSPGRPNSGGDWWKYKFWKSLSAVVGKVNDKRSVGLELVDGAVRLAVGNVTIPANEAIPAVGAVVEVGYLYAFDGGSLFQAMYRGVRKDISVDECLASQRIFKAEDAEDEASPGMRM